MNRNLQHLNWENRGHSQFHFTCATALGASIGGRNEFPTQKHEEVLFQYAVNNMKSLALPPKTAISTFNE